MLNWLKWLYRRLFNKNDCGVLITVGYYEDIFPMSEKTGKRYYGLRDKKGKFKKKGKKNGNK